MPAVLPTFEYELVATSSAKVAYMETKNFLEIIGGSIEKANDLMRR